VERSATEIFPVAQASRPKKKRDVHVGDRRFFYALRALAVFIILILVGIAAHLVHLAAPAFAKYGFGFLASRDWDPVNEQFGAAAFVYGTAISSLVAIAISCPVSIGVSLFLNELAPTWFGTVVGFLVEMLAAIPSVVYGLWGIFVLSPWLRTSIEPYCIRFLGPIPVIGALFHGPAYGVGMIAAGVVLAIMITPTISAICREVFRAIPISQREAALALGATRWETIRVSVLRSSVLGISGAVVLGLGRALGETMAVTMVIGNRPEISASLFAPAQSMASLIANEYAEASDIHLAALAAVGLALFVVSFVINSFARLLVWRFRVKEERK
jgi:phosphate transport system permease protein